MNLFLGVLCTYHPYALKDYQYNVSKVTVRCFFLFTVQQTCLFIPNQKFSFIFRLFNHKYAQIPLSEFRLQNAIVFGRNTRISTS